MELWSVDDRGLATSLVEALSVGRYPNKQVLGQIHSLIHDEPSQSLPVLEALVQSLISMTNSPTPHTHYRFEAFLKLILQVARRFVHISSLSSLLSSRELSVENLPAILYSLLTTIWSRCLTPLSTPLKVEEHAPSSPSAMDIDANGTSAADSGSMSVGQSSPPIPTIQSPLCTTEVARMSVELVRILFSVPILNWVIQRESILKSERWEKLQQVVQTCYSSVSLAAASLTTEMEGATFSVFELQMLLIPSWDYLSRLLHPVPHSVFSVSIRAFPTMHEWQTHSQRHSRLVPDPTLVYFVHYLLLDHSPVSVEVMTRRLAAIFRASCFSLRTNFVIALSAALSLDLRVSKNPAFTCDRNIAFARATAQLPLALARVEAEFNPSRKMFGQHEGDGSVTALEYALLEVTKKKALHTREAGPCQLLKSILRTLLSNPSPAISLQRLQSYTSDKDFLSLLSFFASDEEVVSSDLGYSSIEKIKEARVSLGVKTPDPDQNEGQPTDEVTEITTLIVNLTSTLTVSPDLTPAIVQLFCDVFANTTKFPLNRSLFLAVVLSPSSSLISSLLAFCSPHTLFRSVLERMNGFSYQDNTWSSSENLTVHRQFNMILSFLMHSLEIQGLRSNRASEKFVAELIDSFPTSFSNNSDKLIMPFGVPVSVFVAALNTIVNIGTDESDSDDATGQRLLTTLIGNADQADLLANLHSLRLRPWGVLASLRYVMRQLWMALSAKSTVTVSHIIDYVFLLKEAYPFLLHPIFEWIVTEYNFSTTENAALTALVLRGLSSTTFGEALALDRQAPSYSKAVHYATLARLSNLLKEKLRSHDAHGVLKDLEYCRTSEHHYSQLANPDESIADVMDRWFKRAMRSATPPIEVLSVSRVKSMVSLHGAQRVVYVTLRTMLHYCTLKVHSDGMILNNLIAPGLALYIIALVGERGVDYLFHSALNLFLPHLMSLPLCASFAFMFGSACSLYVVDPAICKDPHYPSLSRALATLLELLQAVANSPTIGGGDVHSQSEREAILRFPISFFSIALAVAPELVYTHVDVNALLTVLYDIDAKDLLIPYLHSFYPCPSIQSVVDLLAGELSKPVQTSPSSSSSPPPPFEDKGESRGGDDDMDLS